MLELLDFSEEYKEETFGVQLGEQIRRFQEEGRLSKEMADCIRLPDILRFLNSGAGKRMRAAARAGCLWREQPFVLGVPASEIYPEIQSEEMILVQGIIDVCFEENGELVVLDYKTDRVRKAEELTGKISCAAGLLCGGFGTAFKENGQKKIVQRKKFPGYVLLKMIMNDETWYVVRNTRGVTSFVGPGSKPVALTDAEVFTDGT